MDRNIIAKPGGGLCSWRLFCDDRSVFSEGERPSGDITCVDVMLVWSGVEDRSWVLYCGVVADLSDNNVPFDNTTPIYLINLLWKLGLGFRLDSELHYFNIFL